MESGGVFILRDEGTPVFQREARFACNKPATGAKLARIRCNSCDPPILPPLPS
jgi:hypothetical protein